MTGIKSNLYRSTALLAVGVTASFGFAFADDSTLNVDDHNRFQLQMMTQIFDGAKDFSQSQTSTIARLRKGDESYTLMNFGDGSVFIETDDSVSAGNFENVSGIEAEFAYDYKTKTLSGDNQAADYFNTHVRKYVMDGPALGSDIEFEKSI